MSNNTIYCILDNLLSILVFAPLVVCYWRGTWQLVELYLLTTRPFLSAWCSLVFGIVVTLLLGLYQTCLARLLRESGRSKLVFVLGSRAYTALLALAGVNHWRGVWTILFIYTGADVYSAVSTVVVGIGGLLVVRGLRNVVASPCVLLTDHEKDYFLITTLFQTKETEKPYLFLLDLTFSVVVVASFAVFVWRGSWILLDLFLFPQDDKWSAWGSCVLGATLTLLGFLLQWPAARTSRKLTFWSRIIFEDLFILTVNFGTINVWRGVWNVLDIYLLPENKELSNWLSHAIGLGVLTLSYSGNSILSRGAEKDGQCSDGSGCLFSVSYLRYFIEQSETDKVKRVVDKRNWKKKDVELANVNNANVKLPKNEQAAAVTESLILESSETFPDGSIGVLRIMDDNNSHTTVA